MTGIDESILMSIPMLDSIFPRLTNQQFINCAFLERTLDLVSASPVPIAYSAKPNSTRVSLTLTSKRHTTTDDSTAAAELTEQYLCACDVEGYRNLMQEMGLMQDGPTVIWQDNQAAIQIAMNRGALAKKTRAMDMRVMTIRNKIEDMKVVPIYKHTSEMIADIGTKALDPKLFIYLRDKLCGYWEG